MLGDLRNTLSFISQHPLNRGRKVRAIADFSRWQIGSRIAPGSLVFNWVDQSRLLVARGDSGLTGNLYTGLHEFEDMAFVIHALRPDDLFIDVGANAGSYTVLASTVADARVIAFEPIESSFRKLQMNVAINLVADRVHCVQTAVGAEDGEVLFTVAEDTTNHVATVADSAKRQVKVPLTSLDKALDLEEPSIIKIDVEGYETAVLEGASKTLAKASLHSVILETNDCIERYDWPSAYDPIEMLRDFGFQPYRYDPFSRELVPSDGATETPNTLVVRDQKEAQERVTAAPRRSTVGRLL